jgi:hypothetical protein
MSVSPCPVCKAAPTSSSSTGGDSYEIECPSCGTYRFTASILTLLRERLDVEQRRILRGQLRIADDRGTVLELNSYNVHGIIDSAIVPRSPVDVADRVLVDLAAHTRFAAPITVSRELYLNYFLPADRDLQQILVELERRGLLEAAGRSEVGKAVSVTLAGWERVRDLEHSITDAWRAFVAMWFGPIVASAYTEGIQPALAATGYDAIRVDRVEHNAKIDDRIIAELKACSLVVADFTGHRGGVYFEAGYAMGRGVPVIWCCRDSDIKDAHFDTRQYNHITWSNPGELRSKLEDRIRATVPARPRPRDEA